jgi:hypothetical protein
LAWADHQLSWWKSTGAAVRRCLAEHYGANVDGHALTPPVDPVGLRSRLRDTAPGLATLTDRVRAAFDSDGACAVLLPKFGLAGADIDNKRKAVFALAVLLGDPTANLPFGEVFWDVRNHGDSSIRYTSFSENDREADYHTDNGSLHRPERFFLLYAVQAAKCGGGVSKIRDGRVLKAQLEQTPQGREAVRVLREAVVPRRIPKAFREYAEVAADGYQYSTLLSESVPPMWRWRKDRICAGLRAHPEFATDEVRRAVEVVGDVLVNGADQIREVVPTDGLIVINNHLALHARTAFTDPGRHLLRLRFHQPTG